MFFDNMISIENLLESTKRNALRSGKIDMASECGHIQNLMGVIGIHPTAVSVRNNLQALHNKYCHYWM